MVKYGRGREISRVPKHHNMKTYRDMEENLNAVYIAALV
jgi:hypothetical protein